MQGSKTRLEGCGGEGTRVGVSVATGVHCEAEQDVGKRLCWETVGDCFGGPCDQ